MMAGRYGQRAEAGRILGNPVLRDIAIHLDHDDLVALDAEFPPPLEML